MGVSVLAGSQLGYTIVRSSRKTLSLEIRPDGSILVRAPKRLSGRAIRDFVASREGWLREKLKKYEHRPAVPRLTEEELKALKMRAKEHLSGRAALYAPRVGAEYGRITIRAQKSRWGSCSAQGNLNFNCLLMLAPGAVQDYVVVHELCHRKYMDHSPQFWSEVRRILPDYETQRQWLKENGAALIARLPD